MARSELTGTRIRERRVALKVRQADLAKAVGISASYLNLIEHNKRRIAGKLLSDISDHLGVDYAELLEGADQSLVTALATTGAARGLDADTLAQTEAMIRSFQPWAKLIRDQAETIARLERNVDALSDRLTHDPALAEAMHEVLSTVSAVRSTASILASTPEIDPNWLGRFHANLEQDSARLAEGTEAMVTYFEAQAAQKQEFSTPQELASAFFEENGHSFEKLEAQAPDAIDTLLQGAPPDRGARHIIAQRLAQMQTDVRALPLPMVQSYLEEPDFTPLALARASGAPLDQVLRRLGTLPSGDQGPKFGLMIIDAAGAALYRRPLDGFSLPQFTAACPLWPVYSALARPHTAITQAIALPDGAVFDTTAIATPVKAYATPEIIQATMLVSLSTGAQGDTAHPVGTHCRSCPRPHCTARRQPSFLGTPAQQDQTTF